MQIIIPIGFVAALALVLGLGLAFVSEKLAVPVDEHEEHILAVLPGVNCGACGFSGCAGYAKALHTGAETNAGLCAPGGDEVAQEIGKLTGFSSEHIVPQVAVVRCQGGENVAKKTYHYSGMRSCRMAAQLAGGVKACPCGCIGLGDCAVVCPYDAIRVCPDGIARVESEKCRACKACVAVCPKDLIVLVQKEHPVPAVLCCSTLKGGDTRKVCTKGCIGCKKCEKVCPNGAAKVTNFMARIDADRCIACGECAKVCPVGAIQ
ncbi:MAG: RnfABCDGE type electron transport complex subunit B [Oscillospiraceae bacterium]|jgi:RnfABCDGE-type electron transport complex B subunit|nr:RnfABCDGE type electron transport complex subunit B [Oscillospiraceae bacterium]